MHDLRIRLKVYPHDTSMCKSNQIKKKKFWPQALQERTLRVCPTAFAPGLTGVLRLVSDIRGLTPQLSTEKHLGHVHRAASTSAQQLHSPAGTGP